MEPTAAPGPVVTTTEGPVRGAIEAGVAQFLGIPYAQAPVGPLRFQAPAPPLPHAEVRAATSFGPLVPQFVELPLAEAAEAPGASADLEAGTAAYAWGEDDWLNLNVWTPAVWAKPTTNEAAVAASISQDTATTSTNAATTPSAGGSLGTAAKALPVMVWIHGGAYVFGTGADPATSGAIFARSGVVVVSINYRLGIEGFMEFPDAPANRGLLDQLQALHWIKNNARAFGGDPDNITVFGESAGAGSIQCLLTMPEAAGLFQRAILQSPPAMLLSQTLATDVTELFATLANEHANSLGITVPAGSIAGTAASFSQLSPKQCEGLMSAYAGYRAEHSLELFRRWGKAAAFVPPLVPVVDGTVLAAAPWEGHADWAAKVDVLAGHTRDEFALFNFYAGTTEVSPETATHRVQLVGPGSVLREQQAGPDQTEFAAEVERLEAEYLAAQPGISPLELYERVQSDYMFTVPTLLAATNHVKAGGRAYVYQVAVDPAGGIGSPHVADLPPLFNEFDYDHGKLIYPQVSDENTAMGERMRAAWIAFASHGNPGWPKWEAARPTTSPEFAPGLMSINEPKQAHAQLITEPWPVADEQIMTRIFGDKDANVPHPFWARFNAFRLAPSQALTPVLK